MINHVFTGVREHVNTLTWESSCIIVNTLQIYLSMIAMYQHYYKVHDVIMHLTMLSPTPQIWARWGYSGDLTEPVINFPTLGLKLAIKSPTYPTC